jgi:hypothetical protein
MKKAIILVLICCTFPLFAGHHTPGEHGEGFHISVGGRITSLWDFGDADLFLGLRANKPLDDYLQSELTLGGVYRFHPNFKAGVFYHLNTGLRHDDDWILKDDWVWADTSLRFENSLSVEATPRWLLDDLLGIDLLFRLKGSYHINFFNLHQSLSFQPELTYFHLVDREPVFNLSGSYGAYIPLNFSRVLFYRQSAYINLIQHFSQQIKLEYRLSYNVHTWTEGKESIEKGDSYVFDDNELSFSLGLLLFP